VAQAQQYIAQGYGWMIDLDFERFFDRVNHEKPLGQIAKRVEDKRLLKLIRAFLNAGVRENGLVSPSVERTPQGAPLSPLLSNLVLDELDRGLGRRFVRYADDCDIYARSKRVGQRVMESISRSITQKLKLKVRASWICARRTIKQCTFIEELKSCQWDVQNSRQRGCRRRLDQSVQNYCLRHLARKEIDSTAGLWEGPAPLY
jgi:Reverse transcriptase (RNA-dependent DNA polymerase)